MLDLKYQQARWVVHPEATHSATMPNSFSFTSARLVRDEEAAGTSPAARPPAEQFSRRSAGCGLAGIRVR